MVEFGGGGVDLVAGDVVVLTCDYLKGGGLVFFPRSSVVVA